MTFTLLAISIFVNCAGAFAEAFTQTYIGMDVDSGRRVELELTGDSTPASSGLQTLNAIFHYGYADVKFPKAFLDPALHVLGAQSFSNPKWNPNLACSSIQFPATKYEFTCRYWYNATPPLTLRFSSDRP